MNWGRERERASAASLEILPDSAALAARPKTARADGRADGREEHHGQIDERWGTVCNGGGSCVSAEWVGRQKKEEEEEQRIYR